MNYFIPQIHKHDSKGTEERRNEHIHGALRTESPEPIQSEDIDIRTASTSAISRSIGSVDGTRTGSLRQPDSASQNTHEYPPPPLTLVLSQQWHPKLTLYRFLVILTTLGFGISKAVLSYQGHSIVPITLEWLFTTGVFLLFFSLDTYQDNSQVKLPWLFHVDLSYAIWKRICNLFGITNPTFYRTEEQIRRQSSVANEHPPIRGYDLLVTLSTAVVGMTKSILAYQGRNTAVTSIDWVGTVVLGVGTVRVQPCGADALPLHDGL
ncbi:hypothetical protein BDQ17DRAFT_477888 [Cyathus striatus]|nr:hypothetical protein BDQ17DRAFT_477888 [Cyathus striatus]